jgi:hypothetical protein
MRGEDMSSNRIPVIRPTQTKQFSDISENENENLNKQLMGDDNGRPFDKRELYAKTNIILPPKSKLIRREQFVTIDSQDRNLQTYPTSTHFQVVFDPASDAMERRQIFDGDNNLISEVMVKVHGDTRHAFIPSEYQNILEIQCVNAMIPHSEMWVCGLFPYSFNGPRIDENKKVQYQFGSMPFGPIWTDEIGIPKNVLSEPYLILKIDELVGRGPYKGTNDVNTNAFAKLIFDGNLDHKGRFTQFIKMKTMGNEIYRYNPATLGRLDRWTISLQNNTGSYVNFGPDKSYIQTITPGNILTKGQVPSRYVGMCSTRIKISSKQLEYTDVAAHGLIPGDKIFIYNTRPVEYVKFVGSVLLYEMSCCPPDNVPVQSKPPNQFEPINLGVNVQPQPANDTSSQKVLIKARITNEKYNGQMKFLDFRAFSSLGNYFVLQYQVYVNNTPSVDVSLEYLKICGFDSTGNIITDKPMFYDPADPTQSLFVQHIGYAENNPGGVQSDTALSVFSKYGVYVTKVNPLENNCTASVDGNGEGREHCSDEASISPNDNDTFEINYPFELLPGEYKTNYYSNDFFFIKQRLQTSYTFRIVTLEKDTELLESAIDN